MVLTVRGGGFVCAFAVVIAALATAGTAGALTPNDPSWREQWGSRLMRLPEVWDHTTGNPNVVIAVVDTGVNPNLPDLRDALVPGWDFTDNDAGMEDLNGHGTMVATEIAARGDNGKGIAGFCWGCRIMPVRVAVGATADSSNLSAGVRWAADHGARIINVSFADGTPPDAQTIEAYRYARERGALVVASAGNSSRDLLTYPAALPGVLAVGASDSSDRLYPWSTKGGWVRISAPGCQMVIVPANLFGELCGTSVTAPAISGVAGIILSMNPSLTADQVAWALTESAVPVEGLGGGRVDAYAALALLGLLPSKPPPPVSASLPGPAAVAGSARRAGVASFEPQARILLGSVRTRTQMLIDLGTGRIALSLFTPEAARCTLRLGSASESLLAPAGANGQIALSTRVRQGRYAVEIRCAGQRSKSYSLVLRGSFPVER